MPQEDEDFSKKFTPLSDSKLTAAKENFKNRYDDVRNRQSVAPETYKFLDSVPIIGKTVSRVVRNVEKRIDAPFLEDEKAIKRSYQQIYREQMKREDVADREVTMRHALGIKEPKNSYGITALSGSNKGYSGQGNVSKLLNITNTPKTKVTPRKK
jgi:hypothetical protein